MFKVIFRFGIGLFLGAQVVLSGLGMTQATPSTIETARTFAMPEPETSDRLTPTSEERPSSAASSAEDHWLDKIKTVLTNIGEAATGLPLVGEWIKSVSEGMALRDRWMVGVGLLLVVVGLFRSVRR